MDMFLVLATSIYQPGITRTQLPFLCTGNITLFAHKEHNHGFPDFPVQQYSYFLFSIPGTAQYLYSRGQAFHIIVYQILYLTYWNTTILYTPGT